MLCFFFGVDITFGSEIGDALKSKLLLVPFFKLR